MRIVEGYGGEVWERHYEGKGNMMEGEGVEGEIWEEDVEGEGEMK